MNTPYLGSFLGRPMQQVWDDLAVWESVLNTHRLRGVIELGTGTGAFSLFLALQCKERRLRFMSFDVEAKTTPESPVGQLLDLPLKLRVGDIWSACMGELRQALGQRSWHPVLLFCDAGDKRREVATFAPFLQEDDLIVAHDWGTEIGPADVAQVARLETVATGQMTRFWRITGESR